MDLLLILLCLINMMLVSVSHAAIAKPGCNDSCGGVTIPFPFGIGSSCYHDPWFEITCSSNNNNSNNTHLAGPTPLLTKFKIEVLNISYDQYPMLTVGLPPYNVCSSSSSTAQTSQNFTSINLRGSPYNFSTGLNVFTMRGCPGSSVLRRKQDNKVIAGCATVCRSKQVVNITDGCYGVNCCQSPLTSSGSGAQGEQDPDSNYVYLADGDRYMDYYEVQFDNQTSPVTGDDESCLVSTLVQSSSFIEGSFSSNLSTSQSPVVLVWNLIPTNSYAAILDNPLCSIDVYGLRCSCKIGYNGNPYLPDGCQVVDECKKCKDRCRQDFNSTFYCENKPFLTLAAILGLTIGAGIVLLVACFYWVHRTVKKRRAVRKKAKYFKRNGGLLLQQKLSSREGALEKAKVFTSEELDKATDHFNRDRILGRGGQGTVYKGMLTNGKIVAIKKSKKQVDESQLSQFINEVVILSLINHRHVVKVLGCCLESEVPLLVYEFIPNGTLAEHIHDPDEDRHLNWKMRIQIASEAAGAIAYLHSSSSPPIYHRDIKSSNILLDEKNRAKVADFGSSKTIAIDQTHLTTVVQGTMGYLDPEYFQTYQFTAKSDVYSFGVVLLELITSKRPIYRGETMEQKNLVTEFLFAMKSGGLMGFIDHQVLQEAKVEEIRLVADLARQCLSGTSKMRPTMKEVTMVLESIIQSPTQAAIVRSRAYPEEEAKQHWITQEVIMAESQPENSSSSIQDSANLQ